MMILENGAQIDPIMTWRAGLFGCITSSRLPQRRQLPSMQKLCKEPLSRISIEEELSLLGFIEAKHVAFRGVQEGVIR